MGCQATGLKAGAQNVRLTHNEPGPECEFLGDITGSQGNFLSGEFTSNKNLETGARHDLKNKAYKMGGNVVYLLTQRAGQSKSMMHSGSASVTQTNVTLSGNVYYCQ